MYFTKQDEPRDQSPKSIDVKRFVQENEEILDKANEYWFLMNDRLELVDDPDQVVIVKRVVVAPDGDITSHYFTIVPLAAGQEPAEPESIDPKDRPVKDESVPEIPDSVDKKFVPGSPEKPSPTGLLPGQDPLVEGRWVTLKNGRRVFIRGALTGPRKHLEEALGHFSNLPKPVQESVSGVKVHKGIDAMPFLRMAATGGAIAAVVSGAIGLKFARTPGKIGVGLAVMPREFLGVFGRGAATAGSSVIGLGLLASAVGMLGSYDTRTKQIDLYPANVRSMRFLRLTSDTMKDVVYHESGHALFQRAKEENKSLTNRFTDASIGERAVSSYSRSYQGLLSRFFGKGTRIGNRVYAHENFAELHRFYRTRNEPRFGSEWRRVQRESPETSKAFLNILGEYSAR